MTYIRIPTIKEILEEIKQDKKLIKENEKN